MNLIYQTIERGLRLDNLASWIGQIDVLTDAETVENSALLFSRPQFFTALIAGVVLAFAFQLLLTNLGVAAGISLLGASSSSKKKNDNEDDSGSVSSTIQKISLTVGLGTLISVTIALFLASLLAVRLSLFISPVSGAIVGLVIWGTYFSLMVWVSSTTVGSLIGSVVNTATSGFQSLLGTATAAIGGATASKQVVATAEAATTIRRELSSILDPNTLRENVEDYLESIRSPELDIKEIRKEFENILNDPSLQKVADSNSLRNIDRQVFINLVSSRTDLSRQEVNRLAKQLEAAWRSTVNKLPERTDPMAELVDYLKSASPQQLSSNDLSQKVDPLIAEKRANRGKFQSQNPLSQGTSMGFQSLVGLVMGRADLSDLNVEKIINQLQPLKDQVNEVVDRAKQDNPSQSLLQADVENYLLNTYSWHMKPDRVERDFRHIIYDESADPELLANELRQLNQSYFENLLRQRGLFTQEEIQHIVSRLEAVRLQVLALAEAAVEREAQIVLFAEVENYLSTTPPQELTPEKIQLNFKPILKAPDASHEKMKARLGQLDCPTFERLLEKRIDLNREDVAVVISDLEKVRDSVIEESLDLQSKAKAKISEQWLKVQWYLKDRGKDELNPQAIERDLKMLLDNPQGGISAIKARAEQFERNTLVQLLTTRNDLSQAQIESTLDQVEETWNSTVYAPQYLAEKAQKEYENVTTSIASYLCQTGKEELNPAGIKRDLNKLLESPQEGAQAIRRRLARMDRDTLVQLLNQRDDLTEEQINQVIDEVLSTLRDIAKSPQRLARRTQAKIEDFQSSLVDYLRSTDRDELNPDGIQRDINLLMNDPRLGMESLRDRLSHFDRNTLVTALTQRGDISEEDVNRIVDQVMEVRDRIIEQLRSIQEQMLFVVKRIFAKVRDYLNGLERPELNYEGIRKDVRTLFDDPEAGFEALRDRLSQFDRDTLIAILSSRDDISEADANEIVVQIERTRNRVLQKAERLNMEVQVRLSKIKHEAQRQVEEARKAAAVASWWLFFTALISAIAAAGAGALGVVS
ncbi:MAG: MFS transporter [Okeania sp. SIO2C9]|uniref:MFS transporter n=1 Tax=Okeania sp. SIO2C9 TaxID=2607791 RepID=UPI0013C17F81|nr:MFS transporter [Okeania sp. SIO2C9]NEQ73077.1 MFS transporter [Okeania sp. SIO2C9]